MDQETKKVIKDNLKSGLNSVPLSKALRGLAALIIAMIIFSLGVSVGFHKATFGRAWGEHYNQNFGASRNGPGMPMMGRGNMMGYMPNPHGSAGKILKIELPNIIVLDKDGTEKTIDTNPATLIKKGIDTVTVKDLHVEDFIVVIGSPDTQGKVAAKLIRVIPSPEFLK